MTRRYLFIRLPHFATDRFRAVRKRQVTQPKPWWDEEAQRAEARDTPEGPLVLVAHGTKGTRIAALDPRALAEGLHVDMKLADARTIFPALRVEQHDPELDMAALAALGRWMMRYSPAVALHQPDGFMLDTGGCDHLFGGEARMAADMRTRLADMGFATRLAIADSPAAAMALVSHGEAQTHILPAGHDAGLLDALPVEALRLEGDCVLLLKRLGLKRIGDVRPLPRVALERRFRSLPRDRRGNAARTTARAQSVQWRLDQLCGRIAEPLVWLDEPPQFRVTLPCPDIVIEHEAVGLALDRLLPRLCAMLDRAASGGRAFTLTGYRADGGLGTTGIRLSQPSRDLARIRRLFQERLDHVDCGFGVDLFVLAAQDVEPLDLSQRSILSDAPATLHDADLMGFADSVTNRAGRGAVTRPAPHRSHVPERAQRRVTLDVAVDWEGFEAARPAWSPRPLRLLPRPEPADVTYELPDSPPAQFTWRRVVRRVIRARGPERILPEWWRDELTSDAGFRDYYDVEDEKGMRYWIYRIVRDRPVEGPALPPASNDNDDEPAAMAQLTLRTIDWFVHGLF